jgi:hypothetical protein
MPWQRYVNAVAGELDEAGRLFYDTVVLVVGRQCGKTTDVEAKNTWKAWRRRRARIVYAAQDRAAARIKILDDYAGGHLSTSIATRGLYVPVMSNGREGIDWCNGSKLVIVANTDKAGHGQTDVDDVTIDEAFAHKGLSIVTALEPTMLVNTDPQIWIASAIGDGTDGLLMHYQELGVLSLSDPTTRVAYFEWTAADDVDVLDPKVWRATIPALGHSLTEAAVRRLAHDRVMFARTMLGIRPQGAEEHKIDPDVWARQTANLDELAGPYVIAFGSSVDRASSTIAVAGVRPAGGLGVLVDKRPGTTWLIEGVRKLRAKYSGRVTAVWADRRAGDGPTINKLINRGVFVDEMQPADFTTAAGTFVDLLGDAGPIPGDLWHAGQADLDRAVFDAATRTLGESFAWAKLLSKSDVVPLSTATLAVWAHQHHHPTLA